MMQVTFLIVGLLFIASINQIEGQNLGVTAFNTLTYSYILDEFDSNKSLELTGEMIITQHGGNSDSIKVHFKKPNVHKNIGIVRSQVYAALQPNATLNRRRSKQSNLNLVISGGVSPLNVGNIFAYAYFFVRKAPNVDRQEGWEVNDFNCTYTLKFNSEDDGDHIRIKFSLKECSVPVEGEVVREHFRQIDATLGYTDEITEIIYVYSRETEEYEVMHSASFQLMDSKVQSVLGINENE